MQTCSSHRRLTYFFGIVFYFFAIKTACFAQALDTTVYTVVEKQPEFPGGFSALKDYMKLNVRYPSEAQKAGIKGQVIVHFIVETDGQITDVGLLKGLGFGCDEEAVRVVNAMPRWLPGSQSGRPLRVKYNLPVLFGIDYPKVRVR